MTDMALKESVLAELEWEPIVDRSHIGVAAEDDVVTLWDMSAAMLKNSRSRAR